ncbi:unnamed protein product [Oikopleura dioica]|uniref:Major facilitator superfamily (MFS) profile domain-containing protein n=1 Tax=Oikopleura dioica TaxID=34765 RepID=E4XC45_OIKDI|nr:unnamed protein product [Oikopleura dioica]
MLQPEIEENEPIQKYSTCRRVCALIVLWLYCCMSYCDRYSIAGVLSEVKEVFDLDHTNSAWLTTIFLISYMSFAPVIGYLGDRFDRKWLLIIGLVCQITTNLAGSTATTFSGLLLSRFFLGVSECVFNVIAVPFVSDLFGPKTRTYAIQALSTATPIGGGLGYVIGSEASSTFGGWHWALRVTTPVTGFIAVLMMFILPFQLKRGAMEPNMIVAKEEYLSDLKYFLKVKTYVYTVTGSACTNAMIGIATLWLPDLFSQVAVLGRELKPCAHPPCEFEEINLKFGVLTVVAGLLGGLLGIFLSRVGRKMGNKLIEPELCGYGNLISTISIATMLLFMMGHQKLSWVMAFLALTGSSINWGLSCEIVMSVIPPRKRSTGKAVFNIISHALGDAPSPLIVGAVADMIRKYRVGERDTYLAEFRSMQSAFVLFAPLFTVSSAILYFAAARSLIADQKALEQKKECQSTTLF